MVKMQTKKFLTKKYNKVKLNCKQSNGQKGYYKSLELKEKYSIGGKYGNL